MEHLPAIPTTAELRAERKTCPVCGKSAKNARGLAQHQRSNSVCQRKQLVQEKKQKGLVAMQLEGSVAAIASNLLPLERSGGLCFVPTWLTQLIHMLAFERYDGSTMPGERINPRWLATEELHAAFADVRDDPKKQAVLSIQWETCAEWRRRHNNAIRHKVILSNTPVRPFPLRTLHVLEDQPSTSREEALLSQLVEENEQLRTSPDET